MFWNTSEGPWGAPEQKSGGNPWINKQSPQGSGPRQPGEPPPPPPWPDFDKLLGSFGERFRRWQASKDGPPQLVMLVVAVLVTIWFASGVYQVGANQAGVVMRFGAFSRIETPGLHYHLPYPVEDVLLPNVTSQNAIEIGFRGGGSARGEPEESMMLTQDENIIDVQFTVFWRIGDIQNYLFQIRDPQTTIKMAAESAMREVIGQNKLQFELTDGRSQIAEETRARLQKLMDGYNAGVIISQINLQTVAVPDEVKAAFQDVVNARLDQERFRNEAESHANEVIPRAKGDAAKITQQALAYRDQKVALAQGDADRFKEVLAAYDESHDVTTKRLYLETMESVFAASRKVIVDKSASGAVPYLPLQNLLKEQKARASEDDGK